MNDLTLSTWALGSVNKYKRNQVMDLVTWTYSWLDWSVGSIGLFADKFFFM